MDVTYNGSKYKQLSREWALVKSEIYEKRRKEVHGKCVEWEHTLSIMLQEQDDLVKRGRWIRGPTDLLSIINRSRREVSHSAFIAWLLNPTSSHGFGYDIIKKFIITADNSITADVLDDYHVTRIETEVSRDPRRADIVVFGNKFNIVIENKIDADESLDQCEDLYNLFSGEKDTLFVFLSPQKRAPLLASHTVQSQYRLVSYRDLQRIIIDILDYVGEAQMSPARYSILNYLDTLRREFP